MIRGYPLRSLKNKLFLKPIKRADAVDRDKLRGSHGARRKAHRRRIAFFTLLSLVLISVLFLSRGHEATSKQQEIKPVLRAAVIESTLMPKVEVAEEVKEEALAQEIKVRRNDSIYTILRELDVPSEEILRMARISKEAYDITRIRSGDILTVTTTDEGLKSLEYMYSDIKGVLVEKDNSAKGGFVANNFELPHSSFPRLSSGTIKTSFYEAGIEAGLDPNVILNLSDIFAWDVDFATEIRKGDSFQVLYETVFVEGMSERPGRILAAQMNVRGKVSSAYYFKDSSGRGDYYEGEGKSLSRTLLKSPLRYRRISSYYSKRRFNPVSKRYRPHHGVDYAAPTGTPVESSGDGRVLFVGWKGGYGKYIKVRHNSTYTTAYGHLSRYGKGIRKGARVRQGQIIGKVGSTGNSTGPHLHYEVHIRGKMTNPLRVKSKSRKSLKGEDLQRFAGMRNSVVARFSGQRVLALLEEEVKEKASD